MIKDIYYDASKISIEVDTKKAKEIADRFKYIETAFGMEEEDISPEECLTSFILCAIEDFTERYNIADPAKQAEDDFEVYEVYKDNYAHSLKMFGQEDERTKYNKYIMEEYYKEVYCFCI